MEGMVLKTDLLAQLILVEVEVEVEVHVQEELVAQV
jgi:hypothetical protein